MKKLIPVLAIFILFSCKKEVKKEQVETKGTSVEKVESAKYVLKNAESSVNFTAYKTTKKIGVKGFFKDVKILSDSKGNTIKDALNTAEFEIPVNSIETNDSSRNFKIIKFFFKTMQATDKLSGKVSFKDDVNGVLDFKMNELTEKLPFTYTIVGNVFSMKAKMNTDVWSGQEAISKLNEVCKDLHKGDDGVSKTWNEVDIDATFKF